MLAQFADENFNNEIVRGLIRRYPAVDGVRVPEVGLTTAEDPAMLDWAATAGQVVVTYDAATMIGVADARVDDGQPMPGLNVVSSMVAGYQSSRTGPARVVIAGRPLTDPPQAGDP